MIYYAHETFSSPLWEGRHGVNPQGNRRNRSQIDHCCLHVFAQLIQLAWCADMCGEMRAFCYRRNHTQSLCCQDFNRGRTGVRVCWLDSPAHCGLFAHAGICSRSRVSSPRIESADDILSRGRVFLKYRNTLDINTLPDQCVPWIIAHCARLHGRGRLYRRR